MFIISAQINTPVFCDTSITFNVHYVVSPYYFCVILMCFEISLILINKDVATSKDHESWKSDFKG